MNWSRCTRKFITIIGSANYKGGRARGCSKSPGVLRDSKFLENLSVPSHWERIVEEPEADGNTIRSVIEHSKQLAKRTKKAITLNKELLVLGGDHSCAIGTWSGVASALQDHGPIGLVWVDAHLDSHTIETTPSGNLHGTPVAHLLGYGNLSLSGIYNLRPKVHPENLVVIGARSFEEEEHELLKKLKVPIFYADEVKRRGCQAVLNEAIALSKNGTCGFGLSIDIDAFDPKQCPAVSTPEEDGIQIEEFLDAINRADLSNLIATEIAEFLPERDSKDKKTEQFIALLIDAIYKNKWRSPAKK